MNGNDDGMLLKVLLLLGLAYAIYRIVDAIVEAFEMLLNGLVIIALVSTSIFAAFLLYRHITDKQYGEDKKLREIAKLEQQKKNYMARVPKHLKADVERYFEERQAEYFNLRPTSRLDEWLDRTKQVLSTFRRKEK